MKRLTSILLIFGYMLLSMGVRANVHTCKISGKVSFSFSKKYCGQNPKPMGCCESKTLIFKTGQSQKNETSFQFPTLTFDSYFPIIFSAFHPATPRLKKDKTIYSLLSLSSKIPIFLRDKKLII